MREPGGVFRLKAALRAAGGSSSGSSGLRSTGGSGTSALTYGGHDDDVRHFPARLVPLGVAIGIGIAIESPHRVLGRLLPWPKLISIPIPIPIPRESPANRDARVRGRRVTPDEEIRNLREVVAR